MFKLKELMHNLSFDSWLLGLTALAAILIGLLDFAGWLKLSTEDFMRMVIVGLGLLMGTLVVQATRQETSVDKIGTLLETVDVEALDMKWGFPQHIAQRAREARKFILDTNLNQETLRFPSPVSPQAQYTQIRNERVRRGEIGFRRVEVIFHKEHLKSVINRLLMFEGCDFSLRHYDPPPKAIPILHIMSFDGEHFYLGGFYTSESPTEERAIYVRDRRINQLLNDYWQILWLEAKPLTEGTNINWAELRRIGARFGMTDEDFDDMVEETKEQMHGSRA